jgi:hypothetical protein
MITITYFSTPYETPQGKLLTFNTKIDLIDFFRKGYANKEGYAPRTFKGNVRKNITCQKVLGVVIDYDLESPFKSIEEALDKIPFFSIIYTTKSHDINEPGKRFHIFIPFAEPQKPEHNESLFLNLVDFIGRKGADLSVKDQARFLHLPTKDSKIIADPDLDFVDASLYLKANSLPSKDINSRHERILHFVRGAVESSDNVDAEVRDFIQNNISEPELFLSGNRKDEVRRIIADCKKYKAKNDEFIKGFKLPAPIEEKTEVYDLFLYKDIDFLNVKGVVGRLAREFFEMSLYPCSKCSFFSALALVSFLKHKSVFYSDGKDNLRACTNTLLFARSGFSKSLYLNLIKDVLDELNLLDHASNKLGSQQGAEDLIAEKGSVLFLIDEFAKYMTSLKNEDLNANQKAVKDFFLEIITATGSYFMTTQTRAHRKQTIKDPNISTFGLGVTKDMANCFSSKEFSEGLVTRFLIVQSEAKKVRQKPKREISEAVLNELKDLVNGGYYGKLKRLKCLEKKLKQEQAVLEEESQDLEAIQELSHKIDMVKAGLSEPSTPVSVDIDAFEEAMTEIENKLGADKASGKAVVASRIIEHAKRLICALGVENKDFVLKLIQSYFESLSQAYDLFCMTEEGQLADRILNSCISYCKSKGTKTVTLSALYKGYRYLNSYDLKREIVPALQLLQAKGEIRLEVLKGCKYKIEPL